MESQNGARCKFMSEQAKELYYCYLEDLLKKEKCRHIAQAKVFYEIIEKNMQDLGIEVEFEDVYPFKKANFEDNFEYSAEEALTAKDEIYREYKEIAEEEGFKDIASKFEVMFQIKDCLYMKMSEIADKLKSGTIYSKKTPIKWKCDNCGYEHVSESAWKKCPFCGFKQGHVIVELKDEHSGDKK